MNEFILKEIFPTSNSSSHKRSIQIPEKTVAKDAEEQKKFSSPPAQREEESKFHASNGLSALKEATDEASGDEFLARMREPTSVALVANDANGVMIVDEQVHDRDRVSIQFERMTANESENHNLDKSNSLHELEVLEASHNESRSMDYQLTNVKNNIENYQTAEYDIFL